MLRIFVGSSEVTEVIALVQRQRGDDNIDDLGQ